MAFQRAEGGLYCCKLQLKAISEGWGMQISINSWLVKQMKAAISEGWGMQISIKDTIIIGRAIMSIMVMDMTIGASQQKRYTYMYNMLKGLFTECDI